MRLRKPLTAIFVLSAIIVIAYNLAVNLKGKQAGTFITGPVPVKLNRIPDQAEIIFLQDGYYIYAMDRRGGNVTQIIFERPRQYEHVAVSFDRRFIVANEQLPNPTNQPGGNSVIWLYDLERGTEAQLVPDFKTAGNGGVDWDANGFIYFAAQEKDVVVNPQTPEDHIKNAVASDVYKIRHDGTGLLRLAQTSDGGEADVGVSPDGSLVSYIKEMINFPGDNHTEVWVINPDGSNPRMIYKGGPVKQASVHDPEISPDNKQVAFSKVNPDFKNFPNNPSANTAHDLYVINLDGTGLRRVTRPGPISVLPNWKDNLILYTEINEAAQYAGISIVSDQGSDHLPERLRSGPWAPNWIPQQTDSGDTESPVVSDAALSKTKVRRKTDPTVTLTWTSSDNTAVASHEILFAEDGLNFSTTVIAGLAGDERSFTWTVPDSLAKTGTGRIKIIALDAQGNAGETVSGRLKIK